jgi:hypothetical protein
MSSEPWKALLSARRSAHGSSITHRFDLIAERLLNGCTLHAAASVYHIAEIEFYFHSSHHPDPFVHRHAEQKICGGWYLHRQGVGFRSGTFKGIDLCFGHRLAYGGILIRSLVPIPSLRRFDRPADADAPLICGPSLVVDALMRDLQIATVGELHQVISRQPAWSGANPLHVRWRPLKRRPIWQTRRIGLKWSPEPDRRYFLELPYRYLNAPRRIRKGRSLPLKRVHGT